MYTTIRSSREKYDDAYALSGGVDLLERTTEISDPVALESATVEENVEDRRATMRANLDKLLNYDRRSEIETAEPVEEKVETELKTESPEVVSMSDEDIRPTSTTMQFGNDGKETVFKDMEREKEGAKYKLNGKGKALVIMYAVAVVVVLALIILNTGVLTVLSGLRTAKAETLSERKAEAAELYERIENISSDEYVINLAEEELHMVRG